MNENQAIEIEKMNLEIFSPSSQESTTEDRPVASYDNFISLTSLRCAPQVLATLRCAIKYFTTIGNHEDWTVGAMPSLQGLAVAATIKYRSKIVLDIYYNKYDESYDGWDLFISSANNIPEGFKLADQNIGRVAGDRIQDFTIGQLSTLLENDEFFESFAHDLKSRTGKAREDQNNTYLSEFLGESLGDDDLSSEHPSDGQDIKKRYVEYVAKKRLHQQEFRNAVLEKWGQSCYFCKRNFGPGIVEAAHIIPDSEGGNASPDNGRPLCPNHHKAFDHDPKLLAWNDSTNEFYMPPNTLKVEPLP